MKLMDDQPYTFWGFTSAPLCVFPVFFSFLSFFVFLFDDYYIILHLRWCITQQHSVLWGIFLKIVQLAKKLWYVNKIVCECSMSYFENFKDLELERLCRGAVPGFWEIGEWGNVDDSSFISAKCKRYMSYPAKYGL